MPKERIIWIQFVTLSIHFANDKENQPITARLKRIAEGIQTYQRKKIEPICKESAESNTFG
jgi:hypothetical protein